MLSHPPRVPIYAWKRKLNISWANWLEKHIPPDLRRYRGGRDPWGDEVTGDILAQARDMLFILSEARKAGGDPIPFIGFRQGRWPAVYALLSILLDAITSLRQECIHGSYLSNLDWGSASGRTIHELANGYDDPTMPSHLPVKPHSVPHIDMEAATNRPFADQLSKILTGQLFLNLGEIVFAAAEQPPEQSKVGMSYVFRILARMHHLGLISDRIYSYTPPDSNDTIFRPPTMHLLSTHIMSVLSDAGWMDHEAKVTPEGEESPFVPFKMAQRDLGHEVWLEFILWCCVENGATEARQLLRRIIGQREDHVWHIKSWKPLLQNPESVWNTKIDSEECWRHPDDAAGEAPATAGANSAFHGLGKRTISKEVVLALLYGSMNSNYVGLGFYGLRARHFITDYTTIRELVSKGPENRLEPTNKTINAFAVRFLESASLHIREDPYTLEAFLTAHPYVLPPWTGNKLDEEELGRLSLPQIYDETSAYTGLMEYNIRVFAARAQTNLVRRGFDWLLDAVDEAKRRKIQEASGLAAEPEAEATVDGPHPSTDKPLESCIPQIPNTTLAMIVNLARTSRDFEFTDRLLASNGTHGPVIPASAYGDGALVSPLLRLAADTKNIEFYGKVVDSLAPPLALNTLRTLLSTQITLCKWDRVEELFSFMRDYRSKSWGFGNISSLAAVILRLDHSVRLHKSGGEKPPPETYSSLDKAKGFLLRVLNGEFGTPRHLRTDNYYPLATYGFCQMFASIPGALHDITVQCTSYPRSRPRHASFPIIPTGPFNDLLSALVDVHGCAAGLATWHKWVVSVPYLGRIRTHQGGVKRLLTKSELSPFNFDPNFNPRFLQAIQTKMAIANLDTVRIIARKAAKEYPAWLANQEAKTKAAKKDGGSLPNLNPNTFNYASRASSYPGLAPSSEESWLLPFSNIEEVLDFCVLRFKDLELADDTIETETGGHLSRMRANGKLLRGAKKRKGGKSVREGYPPRWNG